MAKADYELNSAAFEMRKEPLDISVVTVDHASHINLFLELPQREDVYGFTLSPDAARWLRDRLMEIYGSYKTSVK